MNTKVGWCFAVLLTLASNAWALQISQFSPQGEVAQVRQLVAKFDSAAVNFGDARAPAPLAIRCSDAAAAQGAGRWTSEREWVYDLRANLPAGVRCTAEVENSFKSHSGQRISSPSSYQFSSGGPAVVRIRPGTYQAIDEEQFFVLQLSGAATQASLQSAVWCMAEGVGEKIPVRMIGGNERTQLMQALNLEKAAAQAPLQYAALACNRRLTAGASMQLVYGKGVATPSGVVNSVEKRFDFTVRQPFEASFSCERENAQADCMPIRPLRLSFNAPVPRPLAEAIRLQSDKATLTPVFDGDSEGAQEITSLQFAAPLAESTRFRLQLPANFKDVSGRSLRNAASFPLALATGSMPPLAKFAAAPFGIVERFAEGKPADKPPALLPVTLRKVEGALKAQTHSLQSSAAAPAVAGQVSTLAPRTDAEIIAWFHKLHRYDQSRVPRKQARQDVRGPLPPALGDEDRDDVQTRMLSLLAGLPDVKTLEVPQPLQQDPRPFEVVGIPLSPGFHVVEISSPMLGASLLDSRFGAARSMVVRTSALVTNLAVHFKLGRENALAWVTTLDKGQPVRDALVRVSDCRGREVAQARTDAQGVARVQGLSPQPPDCAHTEGGEGYFVSARAPGEDGVQELAFTFSSWQRGIEPWRFNVPTSTDPVPEQRAHSILDRSLLRAGETVSMKHLLRRETGQGFALPERRPSELVITHTGSGQRFKQPLQWRSTPTGGLSAHSSFKVPPSAKLGVYQIALSGPDEAAPSFVSGEFRVEEFRLPVLEGRVTPADKAPLVQARSVPVQVQVNYVAGGAAAQLPVQVSALVRAKSLQFADYESFTFEAPRLSSSASQRSDDEEAAASTDARVVADKLPLRLDRQGAGTVTIADLAPGRQAQELQLEATYADPSGEVQTLRSTHTLWPAGVVAGIQTESWVSVGKKLRYQALALQHNGQPAAGVALKVRAVAHRTTSTRKRMVGGFYSYDNQSTAQDLGQVCEGQSNAQGLLLCESSLKEPGQIELVVTAADNAGRASEAASSVWVTRQGELWFGGEDHDRMDVLPEKKSYQPGENAKFQVRMPFRYATALVAVEREGVLETQVVQLNGQDPTVSVKVQPDWGPNVYVSVLALRGRLREVPWYSFFTWGFKAPREWWTSFWHEGREYVAPTALVDLSKPAFRLGMAEIRVGTQAHQIRLQLKADKPSYPVRGQAQVSIAATLPDGKPAAHAEVAVAAVDQALLELMPNTSWNLLEAMLQRRSWGVETATAQMEIIGRRHYGRKAVPAGGGGGRAPTRELLDTLLVWLPAVQLDAQGHAQITVPLNDSLTTFQVVAVADAGTGLFGTASTSLRTAQDLQIISGLPPLVREDDQFRAQITLRNTTQAAMKVEVEPRATLLTLEKKVIDIPAGEAREVAWSVTAPAQLAQTRAQALMWEVAARDTLGQARDALKVSQKLIPAVPLTVQQATLVQVDGSFSLPVARPAESLADRGGIKISLQPRLAEGLPGVRDWWANYPFSCLEQQASKAMGLRDASLWQGVMNQLPTYLDQDGLAHYFPPRDGSDATGSDTLTAYLLASAHEAQGVRNGFDIPPAQLAQMQSGLIAFVQGKIERKFWSPRQDLDVRKLGAIEALSRYGKATPAMLTSITVNPNQWPTHAVIDWYQVLQRMAQLPERAQRLAEAGQILRARLSYQGTKLVFSTEQDDQWWWLMQGGDLNMARLMLATLDDPAWKDDLGRMANGFLARQQGGAWTTTTANLWGALALEKFSAKFESTPVSGSTRAALGAGTAQVDWSQVARITAQDAQGAAHASSWFGAPAAPGHFKNNGMFLPWSAAGAALSVTHQGPGKPWATVQSVAAVQLKSPLSAGYSLQKTVTPLEQSNKALPAGSYSRGDVLRIRLEVDASADMSWVAITDPIPAGATILGSGLGRDSEIAAQGEKRTGAAWPAFEERSFEAFRAYYQYLPKGKMSVEYTLRLNNAGDFALPPSRAEALYAPEMMGMLPNARVQVVAAP